VSEAVRALARIGQIFSKILSGLAFPLRLISMILVRNTFSTFNTFRVGLVPSVVASVVPIERRFQIVQFVRIGFS
jgi:hypothetical protein